jgi:anthranilate synthase component 2
MHGKTSWIRHNGREIFKGLENPFIATRYHSLAVERETLPSILEVTADCEDGTIMGLRHRQYPIFGVQFHPESILTTEGKKLLRNFLEVVEEWKKGSPTPLPSTASGERG